MRILRCNQSLNSGTCDKQELHEAVLQSLQSGDVLTLISKSSPGGLQCHVLNHLSGPIRVFPSSTGKLRLRSMARTGGGGGRKRRVVLRVWNCLRFDWHFTLSQLLMRHESTLEIVHDLSPWWAQGQSFTQCRSYVGQLFVYFMVTSPVELHFKTLQMLSLCCMTDPCMLCHFSRYVGFNFCQVRFAFRNAKKQKWTEEGQRWLRAVLLRNRQLHCYGTNLWLVLGARFEPGSRPEAVLQSWHLAAPALTPWSLRWVLEQGTQP